MYLCKKQTQALTDTLTDQSDDHSILQICGQNFYMIT